MKMITDSSGFVAQWVAAHSQSRVEDGSLSLGFVDETGKLVGGVSLTEKAKSSAAVTIAATSPHWCTPNLLRKAFSHAFDTMGLKYLYALTPENNARAKKLTLGMGFKPDGKLRGIGPDGDDVNLFGMLREDCRFLTLE